MRLRSILLGATAGALCATAASAERGADGQLNILYWQAISIMTPYLSSGTKDIEAASLGIEPLARANEKGELVPFLAAEIELFTPKLRGFVALGRLAFDWLLDWYRRQGASTHGVEFAHAARYSPHPNLPWLLASYHPSRQNTQTGRLTVGMFDQVWQSARSALDW